MSLYEELKAMNKQKVKCYHFCSTTQKYEFFGLMDKKMISRLMPINQSYEQFVPMENGTMVLKYRFTEITDNTIPQI